MAESLLLRLPHAAGEPASWMVADGAGRMVVPPQAGALGEAAALAADRRIVALLPAADVLLTDVELPAKASASRLLQIVPYALEEQLADDIEQLHFALGRRPADGARTPVAVVARALLADWLAALSAAGLAPAAMYAESGLLPANPGQLVALVEADQLLVRAPGRAPIALPAGDFASVLELGSTVTAAETETAAGPPGMLLYATPDDWQRHAGEVEALRARFATIKVQFLPGGPLPLLAQQLPTAPTVNLLQGAFAPTTDVAGGWRPWRVAAALLVALIGLHAAGKAWELVRLQRAERELDATIEQVFREAMPGETDASDARRRMEQRLAAVRGGGGGVLLPALSALAQARGAASDTTLEALSYSGGALDLRIRAPDAASVDRLNQQLRAAGWRSELTAGNPGAGGYEGHIQITTAGS